jgi:5-deoxy-glucuronate isomerase
MKHLVYGRIILDDELPRVTFSTGELETGLICLSGQCTIIAAGETNTISQYDSIYLPRDCEVEITSSSSVDLVECSAEVEGKYPLQVVRYGMSKRMAPKSRPAALDHSHRQHRWAKFVQAGRVLAGFTTSGESGMAGAPRHAACSKSFWPTCRRRHSAFSSLHSPDDPNSSASSATARAIMLRAFTRTSRPGHPINFVDDGRPW